jgi:hypothetical protein
MTISKTNNPLQQFVVQWEIDGALDGATIANGLATVGNVITQSPTTDEELFIIQQDGPLGIVDPDALGSREAPADRWIQWIRVVPSGDFTPQFRVQIVDADDLVPSLGTVILEDITAGLNLVGETSFYQAVMHYVPQGAAIRIVGLPAPLPGGQHVVTLGVRAGDSVAQEADYQYSRCCARGGGGTEGPAGPAGPAGPEGPAGAPGGDILDVTNSMNFLNTVMPPGPVTFTALAPVFQGAADTNVLIDFANQDETIFSAIWQLRTPADYVSGDPITVTIDVAGDGSAAANATFQGRLERDTNVNLLTTSAWGTAVAVNVAINAAQGITTTFQIVFTTPGQRDGLLPNEPFRFELSRTLLDAYNGRVVFVRGQVSYG